MNVGDRSDGLDTIAFDQNALVIDDTAILGVDEMSSLDKDNLLCGGLGKQAEVEREAMTKYLSASM